MYNQLKQVKHYLIDYNQVINEGQTIKIFKCTNQLTNEQLCVKIINKQQKSINWVQEKQIFELIKQHEHQNVIKVYDLIEDNDNFFVFLEICETDLTIFFKEKTQFHLIQDISSQIIAGYLHLRKLQIIVRDLTPETILCKNQYGRNIIKIASFALGKITPTGKTITSAGTPLYMAPEILYNKGEEYTDVCDIYSLGIIFYRLCYEGCFPGKFTDQVSLNEFHNKLKITPFSLPLHANIHPEFIKLIEKMIVYDPNERRTWEQLDSSPKLQQQFIIWKDKYLIDLKNIYGSGAQGLILQTQDLQNKQAVLAKKINIQILSGQREKEIYQGLIGHENENVIKVLDICQLYKSQFCYLILEKGEFNLKKYCEQKNKFKKEEIIDFIEQIVHGYCFLKNKNIIHRDLKQENIVVVFDSNKKPIYKIIDFGTGKILTESIQPQTKAGTPLYQAPEVFKGGSEYDHTCDIFSFGFMIYNIVFNGNPCKARNELELKKWHEQIKQNPFRCPINQEPEICQLIEKMLLYDRFQRITWEELQIHPLIQPNRRQKQREVVAINNQQIYQQQQIIEQLNQPIYQWQQQQDNTQQTQNDQLLQQKKSKQIKIVEVPNNLNKCNQNNENNEHHEIYDNQKCVHKSSQFGQSTEQSQTQTLDIKKSNQQIQAIPLNNQINISQVNEINLAEYIYQIMQLTLKFIDTAKDGLNKVQEFQYQLTMLNYFALKFLIACFVILDQILESKTVEIKGISFQTNKNQAQNLNINPQEILTYIKENDKQQKEKIELISTNSSAKKLFLELEQQMNQGSQQKETNLGITYAHHYFQLFYTSFRKEIHQNAEIPLLLRYLLEKMNNIFNDFPVTNPLRYQLKQIYYKIIPNPVIEKYLQKQRF